MTDSAIRAQSDLHRQITWNLFLKTGNASSPFPRSSCALCCCFGYRENSSSLSSLAPPKIWEPMQNRKASRATQTPTPRRAQSHTKNFGLLQELEFGFLSSSVHVGGSSIFSMFYVSRQTQGICSKIGGRTPSLSKEFKPNCNSLQRFSRNV